MKVEIRRNRDITFKVSGDFPNLKGLFPEMTPEQLEKQADFERRRHTYEKKLWKIAFDNRWKDLDGNDIMPATHEIGYDWEETSEKGVMRAKTVWIRPIKSEFM